MPRRNYTKKIHLKNDPAVNAQLNICRQKARFPTQKQAQYAAETKMLADNGVDLSSYHCSICQKWHITSKNSTVK